jgi:hypothetical protein
VADVALKTLHGVGDWGKPVLYVEVMPTGVTKPGSVQLLMPVFPPASGDSANWQPGDPCAGCGSTDTGWNPVDGAFCRTCKRTDADE